MGEVFLDRYEAEREVGQGGMAVVYRGTDRVLHRPVAIKVLHPHLSQKAEARARFAREARVIAKLRHPNVVEVYDFAGEDSDRAFIVTEFVEGVSLGEFLKEHGPIQPEVAALVTAGIARALHHAHERGVIHRDVKPENIMVRRDGVLKLMDFGIAHVVDMEHLTVTGAILGSPAHMSPEQVDGRALDARTDVFSLGTLFYLMATCRYPFTADTASGLLRSIVEARVPDVRTFCPAFSDDLHRVLKKMMARDVADRYQTAAEVADALDRELAGLGLSTDSGEVGRFFRDPAARTAEVRKVVAAARMERAKEFLKKGRAALAIRELNVVLADAPDDEEARKWLARTRKAARRKAISRTTLLVGAGIAALVAVGVAAWQWIATADATDETPAESLHAGPPEPEATAPGETALSGVGPPSAVPPGEGDSAPVASRGATRPATGPGGQNGRGKGVKVSGGGAATAPGPVLVPLRIQADPPAALIFLDDRPAAAGSVEVSLAPGRHHVRLAHPNCPGCVEREFSFPIDAAHPPTTPLRFSIGYRDATLTVPGPAGAQVVVGGVLRGRTNEPFPVPMRQPEAVEKVMVQVEGLPPRTARVTLKAGETQILTLP